MFKGKGDLGKFEDNKVAYLNDSYDNEKTQLTYYRLFKLFMDLEEIKNKDIALFNREELLQAISAIPTYSKRTINQIDSTLNNYIDWACKRGINPTSINPMQSISVKEHLEKNINTKVLSQKFITKEDLKQLRDKVESGSDTVLNAQDFICVVFPFYGIYGRDCCEMINLRNEDVQLIDKIITVKNEDDSERVIKADSFLIDLIEEAQQEVEYIRAYRGKSQLFDIGYVLKNTKEGQQITSTGVRTRVKKCMKAFNEVIDEKSRLTFKSLVASGKINRLEEIKLEKGELVDQDFRNVMIEFGDNPKSYFGLKEDYYLAVDKAD